MEGSAKLSFCLPPAAGSSGCCFEQGVGLGDRQPERFRGCVLLAFALPALHRSSSPFP